MTRTPSLQEVLLILIALAALTWLLLQPQPTPLGQPRRAPRPAQTTPNTVPTAQVVAPKR